MNVTKYYNFLDGENLCNIFASLIVNKINESFPNANTEISVINVRNFFIIKGYFNFNSYFLNFSVGHLRFGHFKLRESANPNFIYFVNLFLSPSSLHLNLIFSILQWHFSPHLYPSSDLE